MNTKGNDAHPQDPGIDAEERIHSVRAGRGQQWLVIGWRLFRKAPWVWLGFTVVLMAAFTLIGKAPLFGNLAAPFLMTFAVAGWLAGCQALEQGEELRFAHLFAGFRRNTGKLAVVGVLSLVGHAAIILVVFAIGGGSMIGAMMSGAMTDFSFHQFDGNLALALGGMLFAILVGLALLVPLAMALWFAPALVLFADLEPLAALERSFAGCMKNLLPFLVYGVVGLILLVLALLPLLLGLLVLIPVLLGSIYAAYADIYGPVVAVPSSSSTTQ